MADFKHTTERDSDGLLNLKIAGRDFSTDFPVMKTSITTTEKFGKLVSNVFRGIFNDYSGCFLTPGRGGEVVFNVYFVKGERDSRDPSKYDGIRFVNDPNQHRNIFEAYASKFSKHMYEITEDCKKVLEPLIEDRYKVRVTRKENGKVIDEYVPDWNKLTSEVSDNNRFRNEVIYGPTDITNLKVAGLDIYKFLKRIYGEKDGEDTIEYRVRFEAPLSPTANGSPNRIFVIDRIKKSDIGKILNYNGRPMRTVGGINKY